MTTAGERPTASERLRQFSDDLLNKAAPSAERFVNTQAFADLFAQVTGNALALSRVANDALDGLVRNARLAGRTDMTSLGRQLARTEDKLEQVLQLVEDLEEEVRAARAEAAEQRLRADQAEHRPDGGPAAPSAAARKRAARPAARKASPATPTPSVSDKMSDAVSTAPVSEVPQDAPEATP